jgi:hypothetical protein
MTALKNSSFFQLSECIIEIDTKCMCNKLSIEAILALKRANLIRCTVPVASTYLVWLLYPLIMRAALAGVP